MTEKAQIIFAGDKPAFVVIPYDDYMARTGNTPRRAIGRDEFVPFILDEYIRNPLRIMRIKAGLNQSQFARKLGVSQGYVSRIEGRNYEVSGRLLKRAKAALRRGKSRAS